jgi:hypothetical protein
MIHSRAPQEEDYAETEDDAETDLPVNLNP